MSAPDDTVVRLHERRSRAERLAIVERAVANEVTPNVWRALDLTIELLVKCGQRRGVIERLRRLEREGGGGDTA